MKFWARAGLLEAHSSWLKWLAFALGLAGTIVVLVISRGNGRDDYFFWRQLGSLAVSTYALLWCSQCTPDELRRWTPLLTLLGILSLIGVLVLDAPINGMRGWYRLGDFSAQPGELTKPVFVLSLAWLWGKRDEPSPSWGTFLASVDLLLLWMAPLLLQPDLGTALVYAAVFFGLYWVQGARWSQLTVLLGGGVLGALGMIWRHPYLLERFQAFFLPSERSIWATGWQAGQMQECLRHGGWFGTFLQGGALTRVPYRMNDSLFAVAAEQLGFLGMLPIVLLLFAWMGFCSYWALRLTDRFSRILVLGAGIMLSIQGYIHLAVNLGLMPTTGITLPFFSYGGSSLLATMILLGITEAGTKQA